MVNQTFDAIVTQDHAAGERIRPTIWPTPVLHEGDDLAFDILAVGSPETNVVAPVTRPLASTVTFGYVPATTPVAANEATPAATANGSFSGVARCGPHGIYVPRSGLSEVNASAAP